MSQDGDELLSDEDMFSPKKTTRSHNIPATVTIVPGCKESYIAKYKKLLNGIPPPPDHTNPDYHLDKVLRLWRENQALLWTGNGKVSDNSVEDDKYRDFNHPLGHCTNIDRSCEEFELMGLQVCERYIWCETAATTSTAYLKLTQSAKKRRKANGWGMSPRTRISYLTRRTTTFQKDNIASAVAANKTTQILVARSEPGKKVSGKGNGMKGKRALFLSPEHDNKFQTPEQGKSKRLIRRLTMNSSPLRAESERALRSSDSAQSSEKKRCSRSLFSTTSESTRNSLPPQQPRVPQVEQVQQQQQQQIGGLSAQHKQKMLWAVSNALKAVKIRMADPEFKVFATRLFKATTEKWRAAAGPSSGDRKASTSDAMLSTAKSLVEGITGRKMSPKSAKKIAPKSQKIRTPEKTVGRDENNPPVAKTPKLRLSEVIINDSEVFPLERVGILSEKLDPGGNVSNVSSSIKKSPEKSNFVEEPMDVDGDLLTSRKRKRLETERHSPRATEVMVSQRLRSRTPRKTSDVNSVTVTADSVTARPSHMCDVGILDDSEDLPTAKRKKIESTTPVKCVTLVRQSPRLGSRTPLKSSTGATPSKSLTTRFKTPSKSMTPRKPLATIGETPPKPPPRTPRSALKLIGTPPKSSGCETPPKKVARFVLSPMKLVSESKSPAVRRVLTPTSKTRTPPKRRSPSIEEDVLPQLEHMTPKKCVTFDESDLEDSFTLLPAEDDKPPVLKSVVLQRRSLRCLSADLPPPKLVREIGPSSPENDCTSDGIGQRSRTSLSKRRASAPTPGRSSTDLEAPDGTTGRKNISLSLTGARRSITPEDPAETGTPSGSDTPRQTRGRRPRKSKTPEEPTGNRRALDEVSLTPRRSGRKLSEVHGVSGY